MFITPGGDYRQRRTAQVLGALPAFTPGGARRQAATGAVVKPAAELVGDVLFGPSGPVAPAPTTPTAAPSFGALTAADLQAATAENIRGAAEEARLSATGPMTAEDIRGGVVVPPSGTGAFVNNTTGVVTNLDSRAAAPTGPGATPSGYVNRAAPGALASFFGAAMDQKHIAGQEATALATALKMPGLQKDTAAAQKDAIAVQIAAKLADPTTTEAEKVRLRESAGALVGHFDSGTVTVPQGYMGDFKSDIPLVTTKGPGAGTVQLVQPTRAAQPVSFAEAKTRAMQNPQYKYTTDAQLRADIIASGEYNLTD